MTGVTIQAAASSSKNNGMVDLFGSTTNLRVDHCHLIVTPSDATGFELDGKIEGVFDHDVLDLGDASTFTNGIRVYNDLLDSVGNGDGGFQAPSDWGSQHFIFLESSQINGGFTNDCADAGRMVERYNAFLNTQNAMQAHPTKDYAGPARGCRAQEFYHNYINTNSTFAIIGGQGGTWLIWGNTVSSSTASWFWAGATYRSCSGCNGAPAGVFPPNGWGQCGSDMNYPGTPGTPSPWDGNSSTTTGYPCLDGLGRGQQQDAMNGADFPNRVDTVTGKQSWPHQYLEPIYMWMNTLPSGLYTQESLNQDDTTQNGRDIYYDNLSFNGSSGTGYGALASRPATCTPGPGGTYAESPTGSYGVAYFATDANGGRGELYVCTATNTWTAIYEPYVYPHPLVSGISAGGGAGAGGTGAGGAVFGGAGGGGATGAGGTAGAMAAGGGVGVGGGASSAGAAGSNASPSGSSGCGCRVPRRDARTPLGALLSALGVGLFIERRRARR